MQDQDKISRHALTPRRTLHTGEVDVFWLALLSAVVWSLDVPLKL